MIGHAQQIKHDINTIRGCKVFGEGEWEGRKGLERAGATGAAGANGGCVVGKPQLQQIIQPDTPRAKTKYHHSCCVGGRREVTRSDEELSAELAQ